MKDANRSMIRSILVTVAALGALSAAAGAANQTPGSEGALSARLAMDQSNVSALQSQLKSDMRRSGTHQVADLFGPSDEEKAAQAAAVQREQSQDSNIATLNQRANDLEDSIRKLNGQIEVLNHRLDEMDQRAERMRKEFDYKLCSLSAQQLGANGQPGNAIPCTPGAVSSADQTPPADASANTNVVRLAPPPGVLGTMSQGPNPAAEPPAASPSPGSMTPLPPNPNQLASIDTRTQFQAAMDLLAKERYDEARAAFRTFADTYPKDSLAPQALYWLGDVAYVQKDYTTAARTFAEELKKYPQSSRGAESMLKLGQSLIAMNQKQEGCTALAALNAKYPSASKTVVSEAQAVRKAGGCRR